MKKEKVIVAMSGGVDSSLTAALLLEQGFEVIGVTMQIWDPEQTEVDGDFVGCCSLTAVEDARAVADKLDIPYYVLNFRSLFEKEVIDNFIEEYLRGRTPNPCVVCNRRIKFEALLDKALRLGADYVATGHYARLSYDGELGKYVIRKGVDFRKDQSYFLYTMTQQQIARTLMPLGGYTKDRVREMAEERGIKTAQKPESQEICFVTNDDYHSFIEDNAGARIEPGPFLDLEGNVLGRHKGIPFYTIGQRRGLGLAMGQRVYVVDIDPRKNAVIVGPREALDCHGLETEDNNFILFDSPESDVNAEVQIRYNSIPTPARLFKKEEDRVEVKFERPQRGVAPGQAAVFYRGDYLLGGGTIAKRVE